MQGEAAISIVAQTIPVIRVLLQQGDSSSVGRAPSSRQPTAAKTKNDLGLEGPQTGAGAGDSKTQSIALVQLPTGRIVPADSDEGRAYQREQQQQQQQTVLQSREEEVVEEQQQREDVIADAPRDTLITIDDEVHKIWQEMGLSRRAWSKSPSPSPGPRDTARRGSAI